MADASPLRTMSVEEYLRFDERSPIRHEFVSGELYAMTGATVRHNRIVRNIGTRLSLVAGEGPCDVFMSDMRLAVADDVFYYPNVMVTCTPLAELDVIARHPCVVVEVTSPDSARIDRGEKLDAYRRVPALRAYVIVDHRRRRVERHWRDAETDGWRREEIVSEGVAWRSRASMSS
jgi:Uma2 family endonuclease